MGTNQTVRRDRCPFCGMPVNTMSAVCPNPKCGAILQQASAYNQDALRLLDKMNSLLSEINDLPGWSDKGQAKQAELGSLILKAKMLYGKNEQIATLINELEERRKKSIKKKRVLDVVRMVGPFLLVISMFALGFYLCYLAFTL
ncbi:hypothetical protein [Porphyromonas uenonis]|uniref:hypothetical protein n=1 Tax=Porphyromonas uenonis TaxID=281920 RepID=UPI0026EB3600|nr:hypothetical protein [Porphyromonas uenonis]